MEMNRRHFLMPALGAPAIARAQKDPALILDRGFAQVTRIADGVYVTIANPAKGSQCLSSGAVIVGRDASLIVEGHFFPEGRNWKSRSRE